MKPIHRYSCIVGLIVSTGGWLLFALIELLHTELPLFPISSFGLMWRCLGFFRDGDVMMIASSTEHLERRIAVWVKCLDDDFKTDLIQTADTVGGGSLPGNTIPSVALSITSPRSTPDQLAAALRKVTPPIIGKIESGSLLLAPRTVLEREDEMVATVLGSL